LTTKFNKKYRFIVFGVLIILENPTLKDTLTLQNIYYISLFL